MNPFELVFGIVAIVFLARILRDRYRYGAHLTNGKDNEATQMLAQEVQQLKQRIQVLERVITDNHSSVDLGAEIERLRDR